MFHTRSEPMLRVGAKAIRPTKLAIPNQAARGMMSSPPTADRNQPHSSNPRICTDGPELDRGSDFQCEPRRILPYPTRRRAASRNRNISPTEWSRTSLPRCRGSNRFSSSPVIPASPTRVRPSISSEVGRDLGVRYVLEGSVRKAGNRVRKARPLLSRAIDLDPNQTTARYWREWTHIWLGEIDAAIEQFQVALLLSPLDPWIFTAQGGGSLLRRAGWLVPSFWLAATPSTCPLGPPCFDGLGS